MFVSLVWPFRSEKFCVSVGHIVAGNGFCLRNVVYRLGFVYLIVILLRNGVCRWTFVDLMVLGNSICRIAFVVVFGSVVCRWTFVDLTVLGNVVCCV